MEYLKTNSRAIIAALLIAAAIIGIATIVDNGNSDKDDNQNATSQSEGEQSGDDSKSPEDAMDSEDKQDETANTPSDSVQREATAEVSEDDESLYASASSGDNQTVMVRKYINKYLGDKNIDLSAEQRLFVETNLVQDLGANDNIPVGEQVRIAKADIDSRVEQAKNLSQAQITNWAKYL